MPRVKAGNPLWVEWLEQRSEELAATGSKSSQTYKKAAKGLAMNPIPFIHPNEALSITGIGPSIKAFLVGKMKDHCEQEGEEMPEAVGPSRQQAASKVKKKQLLQEDEDAADAAKEARRNRTLGLPDPSAVPYKAPILDGEEDRPLPSSPPKRKVTSTKASSSKAYVPRLRSGNYAILLALYQCSRSASDLRFCVRAEIVEYAAALCDVSFDKGSSMNGGHAEGGAKKYYTGWSSMSKLIDEGLVEAFNKSPKKWRLTDSGYELANKLAASADIAQHPQAPSSGNLEAPESSGERDWGPGRVLGGKTPATGRFPKESAYESSRSQEDLDFQRELDQVLLESRRTGGGSGGVGASTSKRIQEPPTSSLAKTIPSSFPGEYSNGRKAANGFYAKGNAPAYKSSNFEGSSSPFEYVYLDEADARVPLRDQAEVAQEEGNYATIYRIEYRISLDSHQMARSVLRKSPLNRHTPIPGPLTTTGYLRARVANEVCPGIGKDVGTGSSTTEDARRSLLGNYKAPPKIDPSALYRAPPEIRRSGSDMPTATLPPMARSSSLQAPQASHASGTMQRTSSAPTASKSYTSLTAPTSTTSASPYNPTAPKLMSTTYDPLLHPVVNRHPLDPISDPGLATPYIFKEFVPEVLLAGSFRVVLIIDTREVGSSKTNRNEISDKLKAKGVLVDRKMLPLGDMIWVARRYGLDGEPTGEEDIVLDAIVERKRLDDLCKSIIDGRYLAQKVRMKDSAISDRIYLIEKYDSASQYEVFGAMIWTAKSQLQINDGFYVYESANLAQTINYLAQRTKIMTELHETVDLYVVPKRIVTRQDWLPLQQHLRAIRPSMTYLTSYSSFEQLNKTDAALTLGVQWAMMIQHVKGLSAEKAVPFLNRWPTPHKFYDEARQMRIEVEREDTLSELLGDDQIKSRGKSKKRKAEDLIVNTLGTDDTRGIRGLLGAKIYHLFADRSYKD